MAGLLGDAAEKVRLRRHRSRPPRCAALGLSLVRTGTASVVFLFMYVCVADLFMLALFLLRPLLMKFGIKQSSLWAALGSPEVPSDLTLEAKVISEDYPEYSGYHNYDCSYCHCHESRTDSRFPY